MLYNHYNELLACLIVNLFKFIKNNVSIEYGTKFWYKKVSNQLWYRPSPNGIGVFFGDTGISLPTPIPIRGIADMTILKKDNYYAFATAAAIDSLV